MKWIRRDIFPNTHTENYNVLEMAIWKSRMFSQQGWVDVRVCEGFCDAIFSKNAQTVWFFDIVGGMCASLWFQSFKTQLHLLPTKILLTGIFWSVRWHMRIWTLKLSEKMKIFLIRVLVYNFNLFYTY